jgi:long-chain acyl-CoA synthetase
MTSVRMPRVTIQDLRELFPAIYAYGVTHLLLIPSYLTVLLRKGMDLGEAFAAADNFRSVISTAAYLPDETWEHFEARSGTRVVNMYGLTETGNFIFAGPRDESRRIGTLGKPVGVELMVVDDAYAPVADGQAGELLVAGSAIISEYWAVPPQGFVTIEGKQWFTTGDLVVRSADGFVRMVGRKKRIIITGGFNVHPEYIERALTALSAVSEAAVVDMPDATWGERVVACVVVNDNQVTRRDLYDALAPKLNNFQMPRELYLVDELPKGRSGKVPGEALRQLITRLRASRSSALTGTTESRVFALASSAFRIPLEQVHGDLRSGDGNWDSMAHLDFVLCLEAAFGVTLDVNQMMQIQTVRDAVALLDELSGADPDRAF